MHSKGGGRVHTAVGCAGHAGNARLLLAPGADGQVLLPPRMIQEEKESTQLRAEELETRVTSGSMEALDLPQLHRRGPIPTSLTALSLASGAPAAVGRVTPTGASRSAAQDLDRMGVMTLVSLGTDSSAIPGLSFGDWQGLQVFP